jgi:Asp-tRNA(Asn)/Glu-tRNA(Gln) amidotransferase A subunit family amidase
MRGGRSAVAAALERIARGADLDAWAFVATSAADAPARAGPLAGVPFGVKDIIDVARMPTAFGLHRELRKARFDAWCVAQLCDAGAIPVGKTRTTAHAYRDPAPTRNPLDPARTPGGSSAGSAAAVGAGHVPFALGTQTIGSVLRPAAYCGVVGFKPTWGRIPVNGIAPFAPSLDHVGVIAADVATARSVVEVLIPLLAPPVTRRPVRLAVATSVDAAGESIDGPRAIRTALERLAGAGFMLDRVTLPAAFADAPRAADLVTAYEAHAALAPLLGYELPPELRALLERGATVSRDAYVATLREREADRAALDAFLAGHDALLVPGADLAPGPETTGPGAPYAAASLFGLPAISVPIAATRPAALGLQIVAPRDADARLFDVAQAVEAAVG